MSGKQRDPWAPDEDRMIANLREQGRSALAIARKIGRSESSVTNRLHILRQLAEQAANPSKLKPRKCQVCQRTFTPAQLGIVYCSQSCRTRSYTCFQSL